MLQKYPEMRPSAQKCLQHSCFKTGDYTKKLSFSATKSMMLYNTNLYFVWYVWLMVKGDYVEG